MALTFAAIVSLPCTALAAGRHAASLHNTGLAKAGHAAPAHSARRHGTRAGVPHSRRYALAGGHVIQCVAFARQDSGIALSGNARDWWSNAQGVYARGANPETGSVLSFAANGRMRLGHVAVVAGTINSRTITIDQSHWNQRGISRDVQVVDVSERNDWTAVRVQLGHGGAYGSIYPTHGFIYPRAAGSELVASADRPEEVAEMPATAGIAADAPDRAIK